MQRHGSRTDDRNGARGDAAPGARIISFRQRTTASAPGSADEAENARRTIIDEDRVRMRQNIASAAVVIVLMLVGGWCIANLRTSLHVEACLEAGHRDCSVLHW